MSMPVVIYGSRTVTEGSLAANFRSLAVSLSLLSASAHTNARLLARRRLVARRRCESLPPQSIT